MYPTSLGNVPPGKSIHSLQSSSSSDLDLDALVGKDSDHAGEEQAGDPTFHETRRPQRAVLGSMSSGEPPRDTSGHPSAEYTTAVENPISVSPSFYEDPLPAEVSIGHDSDIIEETIRLVGGSDAMGGATLPVLKTADAEVKYDISTVEGQIDPLRGRRQLEKTTAQVKEEREARKTDSPQPRLPQQAEPFKTSSGKKGHQHVEPATIVKKPALPSFYGNPLPAEVSIVHDAHIGGEKTRRVGGGGMVGVVQPAFVDVGAFSHTASAPRALQETDFSTFDTTGHQKKFHPSQQPVHDPVLLFTDDGTKLQDDVDTLPEPSLMRPSTGGEQMGPRLRMRQLEEKAAQMKEERATRTTAAAAAWAWASAEEQIKDSMPSRQTRQVQDPLEADILGGETATHSSHHMSPSSQRLQQPQRKFDRSDSQKKLQEKLLEPAQQSKGGASILSHLLQLDEEETEEAAGSAKVRQGIVHSQKLRSSEYVGKTPYEIDAPRNVMLQKNISEHFSKSTSASVASVGSQAAEQKIWNTIETLMADAFSDEDDNGSHTSILAGVLPDPLLRAMGERSLLGSGSTRRRMHGTSANDADEIEMAQMTLNSFMDLLLPEQVAGSEGENAQSNAMSMPGLISAKSQSSEEEVSTIGTKKESEWDQIALAEVALNKFMDVLVGELEEDLMEDPESSSHEERLQRLRKTQSALTLFEVFRWSLQVNVDAQERNKYLQEYPEIHEEEDERLSDEASQLRRRSRPELAPMWSMSTLTHASGEEEKREELVSSPEMNSGFMSKSPTRMGTVDESNRLQMRSPEPGYVPRMPLWAALGGLPMVMTTSEASAGPTDNPAEILPSSFLEGANEEMSLRSQNSSPSDDKSPDSGNAPKSQQRKGMDRDPMEKQSIVSEGDMPDLASISDGSMLTSIGSSARPSDYRSSEESSALPSIDENGLQHLEALSGIPSSEFVLDEEGAALQWDADSLRAPSQSDVAAYEEEMSQQVVSAVADVAVSHTRDGHGSPLIWATFGSKYKSRKGNKRSPLSYEKVSSPAASVSARVSQREKKNEKTSTRWTPATSAAVVHDDSAPGVMDDLVGSTLNFQKEDDFADSSSTRCNNGDAITVPSVLKADDVGSLGLWDVPKINRRWRRRGGQRMPLGRRLWHSMAGMRERGKCIIAKLSPFGYRTLRSPVAEQSPSRPHLSRNQSSRKCLMHKRDARYDRGHVLGMETLSVPNKDGFLTEL